MSKFSRSAAGIWKGILDLLTLILGNKLALLIITVFGASAIWGQEYVVQMFTIIGGFFERTASSIGNML